jgi:hypothetical protein
MLTQNNWVNLFINHPTNEDGNRNLNSISNILGAGTSDKEKLRSLVEEIHTVILAADAYKNIMILHNPKNFGGTRSRPANKVACMISLGNQASYVNVNLKSALANCRIIVPSITELSDCETAQDIADIPVPDENGLIGFEGSSIFIPCPIIQNAILTSDTNNPFKLIPLVMATARLFDSEHKDDETMTNKAITHADNLNAWLYGIKVGLIK